MTHLQWLQNRPFTLSLTSGFFGFYAHTGFVKAFSEKKLIPQLITGSSAGALVGGCFASGLSLQEMEDIFTSLKKEDFWDVSVGFGILKGEKMERLLDKYVASDFSKLRIPLQVSVFDILALKTKTLQSGSVAKACRASCAMPILFQPVKIGRRLYLDGGIADKMGLLSVKKSDLVISHYLPSDSKTDFFETGLNRFKKFPHLHKVQLKNVPRTGPHQLHLGQDIVKICYEQTLQWLESPTALAVEMPCQSLHA